MIEIVKLPFNDAIRLDRHQLDALHVQLGPIKAEQEINQRLEDLAIALTQVQNAKIKLSMADIRHFASLIVDVANRLGMTTLMYAANNVIELAEGSGSTSYNAALSRLERVGEMSLVAVWDLQDMSL